MNVFRTTLYVSRIVVDLNAMLFSFLVTNFISIPRWQLDISTSNILLLAFIIIVWLLFARFLNLYDEFRSRFFGHEIVEVIKAVIIQGLSIIVMVFLIDEIELSREFLLTYLVIFFPLLVLLKFIVRQTLNDVRKKGRNHRNMLIIGAGEVGMNFFKSVRNNPHFGYNVIGFLDDNVKPYLNGEYLGEIKKLDEMLLTKKVENVVIALPNEASERVSSIIRTCENFAVRIKVIPNYFQFAVGKVNVSMFGELPIISLKDDKLNRIEWRLLKRVFDTIFSLLVFLFLFSWLFPIIMILQKVLNPGPFFYKAVRWGRGGKVFYCYKFRSMKPETQNVSRGKHQATSVGDSRITPFGHILRKYNIDELPQFWNVLKGDMSIVGPRPHDEKENMEIRNKIDSYMWRHIVKPGITGWAQVNGFRGGTEEIKLMAKRTEYDLLYIENWSIWMDIRIIIRTGWNMVKGEKNAY